MSMSFQVNRSDLGKEAGIATEFNRRLGLYVMNRPSLKQEAGMHAVS